MTERGSSIEGAKSPDKSLSENDESDNYVSGLTGTVINASVPTLRGLIFAKTYFREVKNNRVSRGFIFANRPF